MVDVSVQTDEQLAADAAREGSDGPAFTELVRRFQDRVWRICYRLLDNEHDAHDAAQEVFVRLFTGRDQFAGRSKYSTWVHGVAVKTSLSIRRGRSRRKRRVGEMGPGVEAASDASDVQTPLAIDLEGMLETLDDEDRAMILLKYAEDYSYDELAEIFGLSVSGCKMRISRAREKLRERYPGALREP